VKPEHDEEVEDDAEGVEVELDDDDGDEDDEDDAEDDEDDSDGADLAIADLSIDDPAGGLHPNTPFDLDDDEDDDDEDDDDDDELEGVEAEDKPKKPRMRFQCGNADRKDREGKPLCKYRSIDRWWGACPGCKRWTACKSLKTEQAASKLRLNLADAGKVKPMEYISTGIPELDQVLGGGIVLGKTILLGGSKGTGKTTVLLQAANGFASKKRRVYFCSGEDDRDSVVNYAQRLGITNPYVDVFGDAKGLDVESIVSDARDIGAKLMIVDSLQVCEKMDVKADIGQVAQLDACINYLTSFAKQKKVAIIVIGHLTKAQEFAGSEKVLHLVDVLLRFDKHPVDVDGGDNVRQFWIDGKSRQGATNATALMEMTPTGLMPLSDRLMRKMSRLQFE
jgi:thymidine kinase